jgi:two-component system CitB family sensor kinase
VGLALVARSAARLGGRVEVGDADARLGGARVRVVLPADPAAPGADAADLPDEAGARDGGVRA